MHWKQKATMDWLMKGEKIQLSSRHRYLKEGLLTK